ncbi:prepilin-type N-terminal cleavage/methylation domain-containing protein [Deinococcus taeanensis]|uniref:PulJ/GspJ family protein n=1 Tax=Deinococcus taeanensis TaxID=2737050 RepID=UPI001CDC2B3D|nr:prepilin-type N-terminal cleavage/methylation domain-containing protein [Deinococcus taeanensis]UBV42070.1 prepilin-type N-terminal cleavage/methylation domain-containing protein [Deinococcus taeanensis]
MKGTALRRTGGLTLIELLLAMAIMGVVLVLITNWQTSTLDLTTRTNATGRGLSELTDLTGYVGDRVRSAQRVRVATSGLSVNTGSGNACSALRPCLAAVLPEVDPAGKVTQYVLYVYRMEPRSVVTLDKTPDAWAEDNVQVLREYRSGAGSTPANCVPSAGETFATASSAACQDMRNLAGLAEVKSFTPYLVSDYLTPSDQLPGGAAPFTWNAATRSVTLRVQFRQQARGRVTTLPSAQPYALDVRARNVP